MTRSASASTCALGYDFNEYLRQVWSYSLVGRTVFNVAPSASSFILNRGRLHAAVAGQPGDDARPPRQQDRSAYRLSRRRSAPISPASAATRDFVRTQRQRRSTSSRSTGSPGNSDWGIALTGEHRLPVQRWAAGADHRPVLPGRRQPARLPDRRRRPARRGDRRSAGRPLHLDPVDRAALPAADLGRYRPVGPRLRRCRRPDPGELRRTAALCREATGAPCIIAPPRHPASAPVSASPGTPSSVC